MPRNYNRKTTWGQTPLAEMESAAVERDHFNPVGAEFCKSENENSVGVELQRTFGKASSSDIPTYQKAVEVKRRAWVQRHCSTQLMNTQQMLLKSK
ncbi:unnamed protein product, partial [Pleuronectes platessa]